MICTKSFIRRKGGSMFDEGFLLLMVSDGDWGAELAFLEDGRPGRGENSFQIVIGAFRVFEGPAATP